MKVQVRLFAAARQCAGQDQLEVHLPPGATVADLRQALAESVPNLAELLPRVLFAVDAQYASNTTPVSESAEIACIPPVSGG
jgi:molybdopterin converting factor subunit 1